MKKYIVYLFAFLGIAQTSFGTECPDSTPFYGNHLLDFVNQEQSIDLYNANARQMAMIDNTLKHLSFVELDLLPPVIIADGSNTFLSTPIIKGNSFVCDQKAFSWIKLSPASFNHAANQVVFKSLLREVGKFVYKLYLDNDWISNVDFQKLDTYMNNYLSDDGDNGFSTADYSVGFAEAYMNYQASKIKLGSANPNGVKLDQSMIDFFERCERETSHMTELEIMDEDQSIGKETGQCIGVLQYGAWRETEAEIRNFDQLQPNAQKVAACIADYFPGISRVGGYNKRCTKKGSYSSKREAYDATNGTCKGCGSVSDHALGKAVDAYVTPIHSAGKYKGFAKTRSSAWEEYDEEFKSGQALLKWGLKYRSQLGISLIIWHKRIYSPENNWQGAEFSGTDPHYNHVHFSF